MSEERYIYENQKEQREVQKKAIFATVIVLTAALVISGFLGAIHLHNLGSATDVKITPESCGVLCKESGVDSFDANECKCKERMPPVPVVIKAGGLDLDCKVKNLTPEEMLGVTR